MFIKGLKIFLRAMEPEDANILYQWENDISLWESGITTEPFSHFSLEQFVLNGTKSLAEANQVRFMIALNETMETIGSIDLFDYDAIHNRAGIGVYIMPAFQNKGYAHEALSLAENYAKKILFLHQLYCDISERNEKSIALFSSCGYVKTGTKTDWLKVEENRWDNVSFFQKIL